MSKMSKCTMKTFLGVENRFNLPFLSMIYAINSGFQDLPQMC